MRLLVYSPVAPRLVRDSLGLPEYSYVFVAERFRPVLDQLGEVVTVQDVTTEAEAQFAAARRAGEPCVLLSFAPPNRAPVGLSGPTICVFAWEFETIPSQRWGLDAQEDWRVTLADHGTTICLSQHSRAAVLAAMGPDYPVTAVPAPIHDRFAVPGSSGRESPELGTRTLTFSGLAIDRDQLHPERTTVLPDSRLAAHHDQDWDGSLVRLEFTDTAPGQGSLVGFYRPEPWGAWSRSETPWLLLPFLVEGRIRLRFQAVGYGPNADRRIRVSVGGVSQECVLSAAPRVHDLTFDIPEGVRANTVEFDGLSISHLPDSLDVRSMALGLSWVELERRTGRLRDRLPRPLRRSLATRPTASQTMAEAAAAGERAEITVSGVVYTTVLNPNDGRKNWKDLVTAFCWTFRDEPRATLILKMTHHSLSAYFASLQFLLHRIGPVSCRVIALHGFLDDEELARLMKLSTYYVNSSEAEGLCMPLMEFLSAGVPAIAPDHTAMADYITADSAFIVSASPFPTIWPQDPRQLWTAHKYRVHWDSLVRAFEDSFRVATEDPVGYATMSHAAVSGQVTFSSDEVVRTILADALDAVAGEVAR